MIYAYVALTVTNPEKFEAYAKVAGPALAKHGGKPEAMSAEPTLLDGEGEVPGRAVILSFPDKGAALAWANDPELEEAHELRRASGPLQITLLG